jgi:hypothetical protein
MPVQRREQLLKRSQSLVRRYIIDRLANSVRLLIGDQAKVEEEDELDEDSEEEPSLKSVDIGDQLPSVTLKNEKGEDIDIAKLADDQGVVIFLVPKADTRKSRVSFKLQVIKVDGLLQLGVRDRLAASAIRSTISKPSTSLSTVFLPTLPQLKPNGSRKLVFKIQMPGTTLTFCAVFRRKLFHIL